MGDRALKQRMTVPCIIRNRRERHWMIPAAQPWLHEMSKALTWRGLRCVGSTSGYIFMQATGMVSDHRVGCFRHDQV